MSDDTRRILDLLAQGKITVDDAQRLLAAIGVPAGGPSSTSSASSEPAPPGSEAPPKPRYFKISVHKPANDRRGEEDVKIRVPIAVMRGGMRLGAIIPGWGSERLRARLRDQGIDLDLSKLDPAAIETMLKDLGEMNIDIDSGKAQVRITCE
jgi:hypothetical protein